MRLNNKAGKAFTLVELLVVISIIAVLLSILMPSLNKAKQTARRVMCGSNLHSIYLAFSVYQSSYGKLPDVCWSDNSFARIAWWEPLVWTGILQGRETVKGNNEWITTGNKVQICPSYREWAIARKIPYGDQYGMGYAYNQHLSANGLVSNDGKTFTPNAGYVGKANGKMLIMLIDSIAFEVNHDEWFKPFRDVDNKPWKVCGRIGTWHNDGAESVWTDGHVKYHKSTEYKPEMLDGKIEPRISP